ncbi:MAG: FprA family A-type flavoprotein [Candidatus Krumholzibacteriota bacterium]|nr:FprA family A-type flavoprotein [Candidatus Krumholzibacteriota bacterium]
MSGTNGNRLHEGIDWVGYVDWTVRDFHGYDTERGATYNAYLVRDEKTALIDTVKEPYAGTLLARVAALVDPAAVDYVVVNHAEPDHAGGLPQVLAALPRAKVVCNARCREALGEHFDTAGWDFHVVATGDELPLGKRQLRFIDTPMVHWPESMFTYLPEERLLFSMDAFGQHLASTQRFDDGLEPGLAMAEARTYYANIVLPYGRQVAKTLAAAAELDIAMIAPSHGVIWRRGVASILAAYADWAAHRPRPRVVVAYDTMWDSTGRMARAITEGAAGAGVEASLHHVRHTTLTRLVTEVMEAAGVAFGSATLNAGMMPMAAAALTYLRGLRPRNKAAFAFGSYGWGKGGPEAVDAVLDEMGWERIREPLRVRYRPGDEDLVACRQAGEELARRALALVAEHGEPGRG